MELPNLSFIALTLKEELEAEQKKGRHYISLSVYRLFISPSRYKDAFVCSLLAGCNVPGTLIGSDEKKGIYQTLVDMEEYAKKPKGSY